MKQEEELVNRLVGKAALFKRIMERQRVPRDLRQPLLVTLLLKDVIDGSGGWSARGFSYGGVARELVPKGQDGGQMLLSRRVNMQGHGAVPAEVFFDGLVVESKSEAVVGAAYYLHVILGRRRFTAREVQEVLMEARLPDQPANVTDLMNKLAARRKWFLRVGSADRQALWTLSRAGERFVQRKLKEGNPGIDARGSDVDGAEAKRHTERMGGSAPSPSGAD